jgi:hypothetical protein
MARKYSKAAGKSVKNAMEKRKHAEERAQWQEGQEQEAGYRDRPFGGPRIREERADKVQEEISQKIQVQEEVEALTSRGDHGQGHEERRAAKSRYHYY